MEWVPCNICGSNNFTEVNRVPDLFMGRTVPLFTFVKCNQCGLVYQNPRPTEDEMGEHYPPEYEPFAQERPANTLIKKVNLAGIDKRCKVVNRLKSDKTIGRLLDIGCSTGIFLDRLQRTKTWELWGVEPNDSAARIAREKYGLNVFHGDLFQASLQENFFSVVTLWDVLEHLPNPSSALDEIAWVTIPNGYLVFRTHIMDSLDAKLFGSSWAGFDAPRHYYVFSKRNLTTLLQSHGYEIQQVIGNIGVYPTFLLSLRFWLTNHGAANARTQKIYSVLSHPISKVIAAPIFYFYGLFGFGSEITIIAKKK